MVDMFIVLLLPGGGDDLQGIKRGVIELADLVVVNKADGDLATAAGRTVADYANALHLVRPRWSAWSATAMSCSALEQTGIGEVWASSRPSAPPSPRRERLTSTGPARPSPGCGPRCRTPWSTDSVTIAAVAALVDGLEADVAAGAPSPPPPPPASSSTPSPADLLARPVPHHLLVPSDARSGPETGQIRRRSRFLSPIDARPGPETGQIRR